MEYKAEKKVKQSKESSPEEKKSGSEGLQEVSKGHVLKNIREEKGLSIELVHEATKIPVDVLRAIEEGYTVRLLSPFYYRGFVKIYAKYLGVDISDVLDNYRSENLPKPIKKDVDDLQGINIDKIYDELSRFLTRKRKQQIVVLLGIVLSLFLLFKIITFFTSRPQAKVVKKEQVEIEKIEKVEKIKPAPVQKIEEKKAVVPPPVQPPPAPVRSEEAPPQSTVESSASVVQKSVILTVRARKSSWLRVKTDDRVVFQSTLDTGSVETWMADERIEISGKNINELEFELNGKMIGSLGRADRKAKQLVVTKDGLTVTK